ncbi:hypothetical protein PSTG_11286 [Puccinia striiformis f. sp. tritici PST-78]|uniref:J domain-containing protein n=1 Tax=Puccinia striiformis f. sp. tritici PST-78 TaxID=1165861 RepID=A0A0L0V827_9BASI|nr:hypothetical protein PSTG_11286 [Puccinia striiformis f. sp. tritici PST-78]
MAETEEDPSKRIFNTSGTEEAEVDLYATLELNTPRETITEAEIRTAYRKQALRYHPDKISSSKSEPEKLEARQKFDQIGLAYKILSDPKLRQRYHQTGKIDQNDFLDGCDDQASWSAYFKDLWSGEVNAQTIEEFTKKYRDSEEESNDLRDHYLEFDGSLPEILSHTMCASHECEPRLIKRIDKMIKDGIIPSKPIWEKTKKDIEARNNRRKLAQQESKEAEELAKELGVHDKLFNNNDHKKSSKHKLQDPSSSSSADNSSLQALIRANAIKKHEDMISKLEAKAISQQKSSTKKSKINGKKRKSIQDSDHDDETIDSNPNGPTEEEFQKIQADLIANNNNKKTKKKLNNIDQPVSSSSSSSKTKPKKKSKT